MDILHSLGVNSTFFYFFILFVITLIFLSQVVFKPYLDVLNERNQQTKGVESERLVQETRNLHLELQEKTKKLNQNYKSIYEESRMSAMRDYDRIVSEAKEKSGNILKKSREELQIALKKAETELSPRAEEISKQIAQKILHQ